MREPDQNCTTSCEPKGKGWFYAVLTAVVCPCHLPWLGVVLGGSAAGVFFQRHFWALAIFLGVVSLVSFLKAIRILL